MKTMATNNIKNENDLLNSQQAMVLMEIEEVIEDDAVHLGRSLNMSAGKVIQIAGDLQKKGLVVLKRVSGELYVSLSKKGKRLYADLWQSSGPAAWA